MKAEGGWNFVANDFVKVGQLLEQILAGFHALEHRDNPDLRLHEIRRTVRELERELTHIIFRVENIE